MAIEWKTIDTAPEGREVRTIIIDGDGVRNAQNLILKGRLWWFPDMSMYVYYAPTHWREPDSASELTNDR